MELHKCHTTSREIFLMFIICIIYLRFLFTLLLLFTFARTGSYAAKVPVIFASSDNCVLIDTTFSLYIRDCVLDRVLGFGRSCFSNDGIAPNYFSEY